MSLEKRPEKPMVVFAQRIEKKDPEAKDQVIIIDEERNIVAFKVLTFTQQKTEMDTNFTKELPAMNTKGQPPFERLTGSIARRIIAALEANRRSVETSTDTSVTSGANGSGRIGIQSGPSRTS